MRGYGQLLCSSVDGCGWLNHHPGVFYAEWLINVPILLVLAGSIALGRPGSEVAEPLLITNVSWWLILPFGKLT